jgi:hypothetical protein
MSGVDGLLGADRRIRVLMTCAGALLAANAAVVTSRIFPDLTPDPEVVVLVDGRDGTVLILGAEGITLSEDPWPPL